MKKKFIFIVIVILISSVLYSQNESVKERYVPIIKYEPYRFYATIMDAFYRLHDTDYIKITYKNEKRSYFLNLGYETLRTPDFRTISGEIDFNSSHEIFSFDNIENIKTDSLFILRFEEPYDRSSVYKNIFPFSYYGIVKNGEVVYYKNNADTQGPLSLRQVIEDKYGSLEKYKEIITKQFIYSLDNNLFDNGLYKFDKEMAISILKHDFIFYWECFPNEEDKILDLFFSFMTKHIFISEKQIDMLKDRIWDHKKYAKARKVGEPYTRNKIEVLGVDINKILQEILTKEQIESFIKAYDKQVSLRNACLEGPLNIQYIKVSDKIGESVEIPTWNSKQNKYVMCKKEGEYRPLTMGEQLKYRKKLIFGK